MENIKKRIMVASKKEKADLVFKNANVLNVFSEEFIKADVAIVDGFIAGVGCYDGVEEIDCTDQFLCPGFMDAHVHIESSMVMPSELAKTILKSGTTTIIADPHEIVNVVGTKAMKFFLDSTENIPLNIFFMLPSSVPATEFETNGASFTADELSLFLNYPRILGLGEVMCYPNVLSGDDQILSKIHLCQNKMIDGHAPALTGSDLQAYACVGIKTDHECTTFQEAYEKLCTGLAILIREGSGAHNIENLIQGILEHNLPTDRFLFCTDDKQIEDINKNGHIRYNIEKAIQLGLNPIKAIKMATYNTATTYGLKNLGAIAPGYKADLVILDNLEQVKVNSVYKDGISIKKQFEKYVNYKIQDQSILSSVQFKDIDHNDIALKVKDKSDIIEMVPYQLTTKHIIEKLPSKNGTFLPNSTYSKLVVIERHGKNGNIAVAPLKGYGITNGAIATSVAHDSHNIIAIGDNDNDIVLAINRIKEISGGYVLSSNGKILGDLPLEVAGLMSTQSADQVKTQTKKLIDLAYEMGIPNYLDPFISLSFLALPVIPEIRLTDFGLFDVNSFSFIDNE